MREDGVTHLGGDISDSVDSGHGQIDEIPPAIPINKDGGGEGMLDIGPNNTVINYWRFVE
jgi:hypothetical protein